MIAAERVERFERDHGQMFRRLAIRWADTAEDAEDAYQESLLQLWRHSDSIHEERVGAWFGVTLRRRVSHHWRRGSRKPTFELTDEMLACVPGPDDVHRFIEQKEQIEQICSLRPSRASVVFARGLGMRHEEIAAALSLTRRQVQRRLYLGQAELTGVGPRP